MLNDPRETVLLKRFISELEENKISFEGFVRDIENVRFCKYPLDGNQITRCQYAIRNMEMLILSMKRCAELEIYESFEKNYVLDTQNSWDGKFARAELLLADITNVIRKTEHLSI